MTLSDMLFGCLIMAAVTYATKCVGLLLVRKQIRNRFLQSFLFHLAKSSLHKA